MMMMMMMMMMSYEVPDRFCHPAHIQTKMQAKNKSYCIRNAWHMAEKVVMKEGIAGLWQGAGPAAVRPSAPMRPWSYTSLSRPTLLHSCESTCRRNQYHCMGLLLLPFSMHRLL